MIADPVFRAMVAEIEASPALYRPSRFWESLNSTNATWLGELGLENFKRTVSTVYFNWMVHNRHDAQFEAVLRAWLRRPTTRPLRTRMAEPQVLRTMWGLENDFTPKMQRVYRTFVAMLWDLAAREDRLGLTRSLEEPSIGNPIEIRSKGRLISQDLANSIRECDAVHRWCVPEGVGRRLVVAELGAGYGRVAQPFVQGMSARYFIFDIPPALLVSQWYLTRLFPDRKVFAFRHFDRFEDVERELASCDVAFFTPNQLLQFPERYFDVFLSISTLPEMAQAQITNYLSLFGKLARHGVYLKQWRKWFNEKDGYEFTADMLRLPEEWRMTLDRSDAVQQAFQERAWRRAS
jgi:putative sugar O-methyltransferase